jgi:hypothetical protein
MCPLLQATTFSILTGKADSPSGIVGTRSSLVVPEPVLDEINAQAHQDTSDIRRVLSLPVERTFVYLDVSDFSKYKPGEEALIINSLVGVVNDPRLWAGIGERVCGSWEAMLCIGDGYIFVFRNSMGGTYFAAYLAQLLESLVAHKLLPVAFHFRMGVHIGPVYSFWDPLPGGAGAPHGAASPDYSSRRPEKRTQKCKVLGPRGFRALPVAGAGSAGCKAVRPSGPAAKRPFPDASRRH